jgi:hypothetical protein
VNVETLKSYDNVGCNCYSVLLFIIDATLISNGIELNVVIRGLQNTLQRCIRLSVS